MSAYYRNVLLLMVATAVGIAIYNIWILENTPPPIVYSTFLEDLDQGRIGKVHLKGGEITGEYVDGTPFSTYAPDVTALVSRLSEKKVSVSAESDRPSGFSSFLQGALPIILILGGWFIFTRMQKGKATGFAKGKARGLSQGDGKKVTFDDVAGIPEAKEELREIVEFLKTPQKYARLGGRIPKGVLLQGQPGTGKTLIAKAIAGEAGVPFYSISGSDFVEMYVGVGASRVRELFSEAKKCAPCIIFIDEIDAVGGRRSSGEIAGSHEEREQTLNALLVEMDGFESGETVVIVGATNRPDMLDPALLRPGRFDRQVTIPLPDIKGRLEILKVYAKKVVLAKGMDLSEIARSTPGFSGADLSNLVNEAALLAARQGKEAVDISDFEGSKDKILMGIERKSVVISEEERRTTAYHEAGHALVAKFLPETDPLHKITIIPRGRALGLTQQLPMDDRHVYSREYVVNRIKTLMGGRAAEEIVFDRRTTGASNDIAAATDLAYRMVCEWGMSDELAPLAYQRAQESFLGGSTIGRSISEKTAQDIDNEVKGLVERCYRETVDLLREHNALLHKLAEVLLLHETIDSEELDLVVGCVLAHTPGSREKHHSVIEFPARSRETVPGTGH